MPACDIWVLDLDMIINIVEQPLKSLSENVWTKRTISAEMQ
jgi:hypothetical protein